MNPQRTELEFAIRSVLKDLGVAVHIPKKAFTKQKNIQNEASKPVEKKSKKYYHKDKKKSCKTISKISS